MNMNQRGNVLIEFTLCLVVIMLFVWGLISVSLWGLGSVYTKEAAGMAALAYARTMDYADAKKQVESVLQSGGYLFVKRNYTLTANTKGTSVYVNLTTYPNITRYFVFKKPSITWEARATLEHYYRNRNEYM